MTKKHEDYLVEIIERISGIEFGIEEVKKKQDYTNGKVRKHQKIFFFMALAGAYLLAQYLTPQDLLKILM